jgi:hypothetical protein
MKATSADIHSALTDITTAMGYTYRIAEFMGHIMVIAGDIAAACRIIRVVLVTQQMAARCLIVIETGPPPPFTNVARRRQSHPSFVNFGEKRFGERNRKPDFGVPGIQRRGVAIHEEIRMDGRPDPRELTVGIFYFQGRGTIIAEPQ